MFRGGRQTPITLEGFSNKSDRDACLCGLSLFALDIAGKLWVLMNPWSSSCEQAARRMKDSIPICIGTDICIYNSVINWELEILRIVSRCKHDAATSAFLYSKTEIDSEDNVFNAMQKNLIPEDRCSARGSQG